MVFNGKQRLVDSIVGNRIRLHIELAHIQLHNRQLVGCHPGCSVVHKCLSFGSGHLHSVAARVTFLALSAFQIISVLLSVAQRKGHHTVSVHHSVDAHALCACRSGVTFITLCSGVTFVASIAFVTLISFFSFRCLKLNPFVACFRSCCRCYDGCLGNPH